MKEDMITDSPHTKTFHEKDSMNNNASPFEGVDEIDKFPKKRNLPK